MVRNAMKKGLPGDRLRLVAASYRRGGHLLDAEGATVDVGASPPDADGRRGLSERLERHGAPVRAAIESMNAPGSCTIVSSSPVGRSRSPTRRT
jgi:hypothetical protein